jgi:glucose-6-phosphate-specific signal transduction histidine kinase
VSITVKLDLPEDVAQQAREAGLLEPTRVASLIQRELRAEEDRRSFFDIAREIRAQPGQPMTMEEIQAEVDAVRAERAAREARH